MLRVHAVSKEMTDGREAWLGKERSRQAGRCPRSMLYERVRKPRDGKVLHARLRKKHGATIPYFTLLEHSILYGAIIPDYIILSLSWRGIMAFGALYSTFW